MKKDTITKNLLVISNQSHLFRIVDARVFGMKKSTLFLFAESLETEKNELDKKQGVAFAGMKLLKILEKVGGLEDE